MEQLINAATPYYYIMVAFWAFGIGIICIGVIIFILSEMTADKEAFFILILGVLFLFREYILVIFLANIMIR